MPEDRLRPAIHDFACCRKERSGWPAFAGHDGGKVGTFGRWYQLPYLLDVQANLLSDLQTRVVVPLVRAAAFGRPATRLHPRFTIAGHRPVMATHLVAAVRRQALGATVASLLDQRDIVISAIEVVWSGV